MVQHEPGGPLEPVLIPVPAQLASDLAFLFAVVITLRIGLVEDELSEDKSRRTGLAIYTLILP
jgi:hypothetical protein